MNAKSPSCLNDPVTPVPDWDALFTSPDPLLDRNKQAAYLRRFHYDSCVYDPATLTALIARVGIDRVVLGADYPVAALDPIAFVESVPGLSAADVAAIAGNNAARLLLA